MRPGGARYIVVGLLGVALCRGVEAQAPAALELQQAMEAAIARAEGSVVCVLISRSGAYKAYGLMPSDPESGRLGSFDPLPLERRVRSKEERDRLRRQLDLGDPGHVPESFGSGVILDGRGLVLTNYHVVRDAAKVFVRLGGGRGCYADIHAADPRSDLAVLRLLGLEGKPLRPMVLGEAGPARRGQFVLALAHPFAAGFRDGKASAAFGILSNLRRRAPIPVPDDVVFKSLHHYGTLLQTDARLPVGSSGGALVDLEGRMIGLLSSMAAVQGAETPGYAIPLDGAFRRIIEVLRRGEEVEYGFLGVGFHEREQDQVGVVISHVYSGSPAEREAGLFPRDVLLAVNGNPLKESDDLFLHLGTQLAGTTVQLDLLRPGVGPLKKQATLAKYWFPGKSIASSLGRRPFVRGLRVDDASILVQKTPRWSNIPPGVLLTDIEPKGTAAQARLKAGEIVTHVDGQAVRTPAEFYRQIGRAVGPVELTLYNFSTTDPATKVILK